MLPTQSFFRTLGLSIVLLLPTVTAVFGQADSKNEKDRTLTPAVPAQSSAIVGRFRVTLTGFTVNRQTSDNILESDGKGDEVYILTDIAQYDNYSQFSQRANPNGTRSVVPLVAPLATYNDLIIRRGQIVRRTLSSTVMGDINNHGSPSRIQAGSASDMGGLRTADQFPKNEPWACNGALLTDQPPMLLWEGELRVGKDLVVIVPTIWEWDGGNPQLRAQFASNVSRFFTDGVYANQAFGWQFFTGGDAFGAGDRPIGMLSRTLWEPKGLLLNFDNAQSASLNLPSHFGRGVVEIRYSAATEDYSLYLKIERVR
jgi:hypothetical protein